MLAAKNPLMRITRYSKNLEDSLIVKKSDTENTNSTSPSLSISSGEIFVLPATKGGNKGGKKPAAKKPAAKKPKKEKLPRPFLSTIRKNEECHRLAQLVVLAIKQTRDNGMDAMKNAIKSVGFHAQDHKDANPYERARYHSYCVPEQNCEYVKYRATHDNMLGFQYRGPDGILAPRDKKTGRLLFDLHADALPEVETCFTKEHLFFEGVLERTVKYFTQNMNESAHGTIWNTYLSKAKVHSFEDVQFGLRHFCLRHNFGAHRSSLHHKIGSMSKQIELTLMNKDRKTLRNSRQRWIPSNTRGHTHRSKVKINSITSTLYQYETDEKKMEKHISDIREMAKNLLYSRCVYSAGQGDGPGMED